MISSGMCIFAQCIIISNLKVLILSYTTSIGLYLICFFGIVAFYVCFALAERIFIYGNIVNVF